MKDIILFVIWAVAIIGLLCYQKIKQKKEQEKIDTATYEGWVENGAKFADDPEEEKQD